MTVVYWLPDTDPATAFMITCKQSELSTFRRVRLVMDGGHREVSVWLRGEVLLHRHLAEQTAKYDQGGKLRPPERFPRLD